MERARTQQAKDERRQVLLQAALDEFYERGFRATRMDDIARRARLSKGTIYLYFDSKEALFIALIDTIAVPNIERVESLVAAAPTLESAVRQLAGFAPTLIRETQVPKILKVLLAESGAFPDVVRTYREMVIERGMSAISALLARRQAAGEARSVDPDLTARLMMAPMVLALVWHTVFEQEHAEKLDLKALFSLHEDLFLDALLSKDGDDR